MLRFAFYRATGTFNDRLIRLASGSVYSHVEFVLMGPGPEHRFAVCISASKRNGNKVRRKGFTMVKGHWDFVEAPGNFDKARRYAVERLGEPYNMLGAAMSVTPCKAKVGRGLFCSEFMAQILRAGGIDTPPPHTLAPGELYTFMRTL